MHCTLKYTKDSNNILSNYLIVHMFRAFSSQKMPYSNGQSGIPTKKSENFEKSEFEFEFSFRSENSKFRSEFCFRWDTENGFKPER